MLSSQRLWPTSCSCCVAFIFHLSSFAGHLVRHSLWRLWWPPQSTGWKLSSARAASQRRVRTACFPCIAIASYLPYCPAHSCGLQRPNSVDLVRERSLVQQEMTKPDALAPLQFRHPRLRIAPDNSKPLVSDFLAVLRTSLVSCY